MGVNSNGTTGGHVQVLSHGALTVKFDSERQAAEVYFDPNEFRSWDFIIGVLEMAKLYANTMRANSIMVQQQQAMQQAMRDQAIAKQILGK
jgi:hypothetical protein